MKQIVKSVKFTKVDFNQRYGMLPIDKAYSSAKKDLIDSLHKNGVLWLTVEYNLYSGNGNANLAESLFSSSGDHAVALVGYKTDGDLFLIRDSNKAGLKLLSANNLLPSINEAFALKK